VGSESSCCIFYVLFCKHTSCFGGHGNVGFFFVCWDLYKIIFLKGMMLKIFSHWYEDNLLWSSQPLIWWPIYKWYYSSHCYCFSFQFFRLIIITILLLQALFFSLSVSLFFFFKKKKKKKTLFICLHVLCISESRFILMPPLVHFSSPSQQSQWCLCGFAVSFV
jgi:hypothetical protein